MDAKQIASQTMLLIANRRIRAFIIGALVLSVLAVMQVNNLKRQPRMCELLTNSNMRTNDLQRMQIALSQSGLSEYKLEEHRLLVPVAQHAQYLQAVADNDAIPEELRDKKENERLSPNPFHSRVQQLSIERAQKKEQIREMVLRLPFVEQAWFEMDKSESRSAFEQAEQSAVISIRTPVNVSLSDRHVDTVKSMIGGAVAGLDATNIVVIDLSAGFAHQEHDDESTNLQAHYRRISYEEQRHYQTQIREILKQYPGVQINVRVDVKPAQNQTATLEIQPLRDPVPTVTAATRLPSAGANSFASIEPIQPSPLAQPDPKILQVTHSSPLDVSSSLDLEKDIFVSIDVPQSLVHQLLGKPKLSSKSSATQVDFKTAMANQTQVKFEKIQSEIIGKIRPLFPKSNIRGSTPAIAVNLIREPSLTTPLWTTKLKEFAAQNWPSAAVLIIGLMLLTIVTRKPDYVAPHDNSVESDGDVLSLNSNDNVPTGTNPEVRLTKLIEKDPDAAAKVIQAWIRDAA